MILLFILICIAGIAKAVMNTLQFHYNKSIWFNGTINKYWDPEYSWANKYSDVDNLVRKKWFGFIPVPVLLTDGWHLFQSIFLTSMFTALVFYKPIFNLGQFTFLADFLLFRTIFGLSFMLFYDWILIKK